MRHSRRCVKIDFTAVKEYNEEKKSEARSYSPNHIIDRLLAVHGGREFVNTDNNGSNRETIKVENTMSLRLKTRVTKSDGNIVSGLNTVGGLAFYVRNQYGFSDKVS